MSSSVLDLLASLRQARTFEVAARRLLQASIAAAMATLETGSQPGAGAIKRASLHLRAEGGYRNLVVVSTRESDEPSLTEEMILPSATAFRLLEQHSAPVVLDLSRGEIWRLGGGLLISTDAAADSELFGSRRELLRRNTTNALALPVRALDEKLVGMVFVEGQGAPSVAPSFVWSRCAALIQGLTDVAYPYLVALPSERESVQVDDELLPVVGAEMRGVLRVLHSFARQRETLLLTGPSGAGKSRLAEWCHRRSGRTGGFEQVDLLSVPDEMQMAELFGWRKGAFTGALRDHEGYVARAEAGTLFLDEVDKLSLKAQAGLLSFLERREYRVLGAAGAPLRSDVRIIVASNVDLWQSVQEARFREDLYYRIHVLPIRIPPLRERRDELGDWARFMVRRFRERGGDARVKLEEDAVEALQSFEWPGNLRQLDNVVHRSCAIALGEKAALDPVVPVAREHVERALGLERADRSGGLLAALRAAAEAFAREAQRSERRGRPLTLDHADAFRGLVLHAGLDLVGDKEEVMRLFGKEALIQHRNHYKLLRKELRSVVELCELLQLELPRSFLTAFEGA